MSDLYKIIVTGAFNAGKTTFVNTLSDISTVNTDKKTSSPMETAVKASTTTALDYGLFQFNPKLIIHLFGTPGQDRFEVYARYFNRGYDRLYFSGRYYRHKSLRSLGPTFGPI